VVANAIIGSASPGNYIANAANIPFSMTGTITAYSGPGAGQGTILARISISGTGIYSANVQGNYLAGGPGGIPMGGATYQFISGPSAMLFGTDTKTLGAWNGKYGGDGYLIANGASHIPAYATVGFQQTAGFTWAGVTSDSRALQNGAGSLSGIASTYYPSNYSNSFAFNLNLTDGDVHTVALYLLDWDTPNLRTETVTITDMVSGTVLSTANFSQFSSGQYGVWNLEGNLKITVTGNSPVLSGIFFGPPGSPSVAPPSLSSATFLGLDGSTQGTWTGKYGANGYLIANGQSSPCAYGTVSLSGDLTYTWAAQTSDPRALQTYPGSPNRIASAYTQYAGGSFTININITDGNSHSVSFYFLDWDDELRAANVTITDALTGAVLSSLGFGNTVSSEANPPYLNYQLKGNVIVKVTATNGTSPAISGIFFN
jgi:hypothetical protein